jgi:hypothetical protein
VRHLHDLSLDDVKLDSPSRWPRDDWFVSPLVARLLGLSAISVIAILPGLQGFVDLTKMSFWPRLPWGILGVLSPVGSFFLWISMWRYWLRLDDSSVWMKRASFVALLIALWYGAVVYYLCVYLPQLAQRRGRLRFD